jgi:hypothetical protein
VAVTVRAVLRVDPAGATDTGEDLLGELGAIAGVRRSGHDPDDDASSRSSSSTAM